MDLVGALYTKVLSNGIWRECSGQSEMARSLAHVIVCAIALPLNFVAEILRFEDRVHHQLEISGWPRDRNGTGFPLA